MVSKDLEEMSKFYQFLLILPNVFKRIPKQLNLEKALGISPYAIRFGFLHNQVISNRGGKSGYSRRNGLSTTWASGSHHTRKWIRLLRAAGQAPECTPLVHAASRTSYILK
jgi:hypothetical protein